jgi:hypothetical protein
MHIHITNGGVSILRGGEHKCCTVKVVFTLGLLSVVAFLVSQFCGVTKLV